MVGFLRGRGRGRETAGEDAKEKDEPKRNEWMLLGEWIRKRFVAHQYSRASATGRKFGRPADYKRFPSRFPLYESISYAIGQVKMIYKLTDSKVGRCIESQGEADKLAGM